MNSNHLKRAAKKKAAVHRPDPTMGSVSVDLRPLEHPILKRRAVQSGKKFYGQDDVELLDNLTHGVLALLGYQELNSQIAMLSEVCNRLPEPARRFLLRLIISGQAMQFQESKGDDGEVVYTLTLAPKYDPLVAPSGTPEKDGKAPSPLWTPDQGRP